MSIPKLAVALIAAVSSPSLSSSAPIAATEPGEARRRWEIQCQIREEKFDRVLPEAMRENGIDMWIVMQKEGNPDPLYDDLGRGYTGSVGYYAFYDPGLGRVERAAFGIEGYLLERCGVYDTVAGPDDLGAWVATRDPGRIGVNTSEQIGAADGLSWTGRAQLVAALGAPWGDRLVSAEKLVSDFRSRRVATEIAAFAEAGELSRRIAERAFSNEVITPGVTTLEEVAWWMQEELLKRGLGSSFDMPSVYVTEPGGIAAVSSERVIQRGDLLMIDWGVCHLNLCTDMKRIAYVAQQGEAAPPAGLQHAFERALEVRDVVRRSIHAGPTAREMLDHVNAELAAAGFALMESFDRPGDDPEATDVIIGCHSVGNTGHGIGPSIAFFNPRRLGVEIRQSNLFSIELFAWTAAPEWKGAKVRIPLEDDAVVTARGVEWLYPVNRRILLVR